MTRFRVERKDYNISFNDFIIKEIKKNTLVSIREIPFELNENSKLNVFYYSKNQITVTKLHEVVYDIQVTSLPTKIKTINIGCELEVCLDLYCTKQNKVLLSDELSAFRLKLDVNTEKQTETKWVRFLKFYIQDKIVPNLSEEFISRFPKARIALKPKSGHSDYTVNFKTGQISEDYKPITYNYIIFTRDASLVCADTILKPSELGIRDPVYRQTLHCEIITPILDDIDDLKLLYTYILDSKCLDINDSQAFHVNVSLYDENDNPIYFTSGFINTFLNYFIPYEDKRHRKENSYSTKLHTYMKYYIFSKYKSMISLNSPKNKDKDFVFNNFVKGEEYFRSYVDLSEKYLSIHAKSDTLLEFRLFPSHNNYTNLLQYVLDCIKLLNDTNEDFRINYKQRLYKFQQLNLKTKIDYSLLNTYEGELYIEDEKFPTLISINNNPNLLKDAIKYLFNTRQIEILDFSKDFKDIDKNLLKKYKEIFLASKNGKNYMYGVNYLENGIYRIELIKN